MRTDGRGPSRKSILALAGIAFAAGSFVSVTGLNAALRHEAGIAILWLGWLSLGLIVGSALSLCFCIIDHFQGRIGHRAAPVGTRRLRKEYIAKYSVSDRAVALGSAVAAAALGTFFVVRSGGWAAISISTVLAAWAVYYLIQVAITEVVFTDNGLVARRPFHREVFKPYADVRRVTGKPGTVEVEFSNGQTVKLHTGLGEADIVISYLRRHCLERLEIE